MGNATVDATADRARRLMRRHRRVWGVGLAGILWAMAVVPAQQPPHYATSQAPARLQPMIREADLIIVTLQGALLSELRQQLDEVGPARALDACHLAAIRVARMEARYEGVAVGRTSTRLRNPANAPPAWAAPLIERYADSPRASVDGFVVDLGERVGVLRPIREQSVCAPCHGTEETLRADVRAHLAERYPADRAVGFHDGDIRGWFWVELPQRERP
jgi:hypothetical protein